MAETSNKPIKGSLNQAKPQTRQRERDEYDQDLNPHALEGQNIGDYSVDADPDVRYAADIKEINRWLTDFTLEQLREIPIVPPGRELKQGAVYLDLKNRAKGSFVVQGKKISDEYNLYVPKAETPHGYWNRLLGVEDLDRLQ